LNPLPYPKNPACTAAERIIVVLNGPKTLKNVISGFYQESTSPMTAFNRWVFIKSADVYVPSVQIVALTSAPVHLHITTEKGTYPIGTVTRK
jgi:hypothetical protein